MAITVVESHIGRRQTAKETTRTYVIRGATDEDTARIALIASIPAIMGTSQIRVDGDCEVDEIATDTFVGTGKWVAPGGSDNTTQQVGSFSISFDISGQNTHYTQSIETVAKYHANTVRDFQGAINVNSDGTVEGVDLIVPALTFVLNYTVDPDLITDEYISKLGRFVGKSNLYSFKGCEQGELMFTGVSGSRRDNENWDISYRFAKYENRSDITVGPISGIFKRGWELLWVYYELTEDTTNHVMLKTPANVYIEKVYEYVDYNLLNLP